MRTDCRVCLNNNKTEECVGINIKVSESKSVLNLIQDWALIQVINPDELPQMVCESCFINIRSFADFIKQIQKSDQELKQKLNKDCDNTLNIEPKENIEDRLLNTTFKECKKRHSSGKKYSCSKCRKHFSKSYQLLYHMRVHTGEKKFNCKICSKSFTHPSNLYKHRKIHTDTKNYKCEFCSKSFIQSEALKIHIRRTHTGEKPFLCEFCSKSFSSQSALWIHRQNKHEQKKSCNICNKKFSGRILKRHIELHKNKDKNIKNYICEQCGKSFSSDHNLRQHLLSHDGIKPYASQPMPCPLCKKLYSKRRINNHVCIILQNS